MCRSLNFFSSFSLALHILLRLFLPSNLKSCLHRLDNSLLLLLATAIRQPPGQFVFEGIWSNETHPKGKLYPCECEYDDFMSCFSHTQNLHNTR